MNGFSFEWLLSQIVSRGIPAQALALAAAFLLGAPVSRLITVWRQKMLRQAPGSLAHAAWLSALLHAGASILYPLSVWLLGYAGVVILQRLGRPADLLEWALYFIGLWAAYRFMNTLLAGLLAAPAARAWRNQALRPTAVFLAVLHAAGLLESLLDTHFALSPTISISVRSVLYGVLVMYLFFVASRLARSYLRETALPNAGLDISLVQVISTLAGYGLLVTGVLAGLNVVGIELSALTVIFGGLSVGIGFGLQELMNNLISGFILLTERAIVPGDVIEVENRTGAVQDIKLRTTLIRTKDNIEYLVPNSFFLTNTVTHYTHTDKRSRHHVFVGASYDADPHHVRQVLLQAASQCPRVLPDPPPSVNLVDFADSSVNFDVQFWLDEPMDAPAISSEVRLLIWDAFKAHHIEIPFPQRDLHIRSAGSLAPPT